MRLKTSGKPAWIVPDAAIIDAAPRASEVAQDLGGGLVPGVAGPSQQRNKVRHRIRGPSSTRAGLARRVGRTPWNSLSSVPARCFHRRRPGTPCSTAARPVPDQAAHRVPKEADAGRAMDAPVPATNSARPAMPRRNCGRQAPRPMPNGATSRSMSAADVRHDIQGSPLSAISGAALNIPGETRCSSSREATPGVGEACDQGGAEHGRPRLSRVSRASLTRAFVSVEIDTMKRQAADSVGRAHAAYRLAFARALRAPSTHCLIARRAVLCAPVRFASWSSAARAVPFGTLTLGSQPHQPSAPPDAHRRARTPGVLTRPPAISTANFV